MDTTSYDASESAPSSPTPSSSSVFVGNIKRALSTSRLHDRDTNDGREGRDSRDLMVVETLCPSGLAVREKPSMLVNIVCMIKKGVHLRVIEETVADNVQWLRISCGWISSVGTYHA